MAVNLAKAYVQIIPSMRGVEGRLTKELGGLANQPSVSKTGAKIGARLSSSAGVALKAGLASAGTTIGIGLGVALTKGFNRLKAFEQAEQSLKGMGLAAAEITKVMEGANKAVEGTAFGLDEAATAAKGLVAAGVKPGMELERVLGLVGDAAAQSGISMTEMGLVWGQVAAKGKLQGSEALQLMERGIPIYQLVAKQLGVTAEEAMKLGEKGKISFSIFADAVESQFAGSAKAMGETVSGSFNNVGAALGRLGQGILKGPFADAPAVLGKIKNQIDRVTPAVTRASKETYEQVRRASIGLAKTYSPQVLGGLQKLASHGLEVAGAFTPMAEHVLKASKAIGAPFLHSIMVVAPALADVAVAVGEAGGSLTGVLIPAATVAAKLLVPAAGAVAGLLEVVAGLPAPVLAAGAAIISLKTGFGPLPVLVSGVGKAISGLGGAVLTTSKFFKDWNLLTQVAQLEGMSTVSARTAAGLNLAGTSAKALGAALKSALITSGIGIALVGITSAISFFAQKSEEAKERQEELKNSLDQTSGALTDQTRKLLQSDSQLADVAEIYERLGGSVSDFYQAIEGDSSALDRVNSRLEETRDKAAEVESQTATMGATFGREGASMRYNADTVSATIEDMRAELEESGEATRDAAAQQRMLSQEVYHGADANRDNLVTTRELAEYRQGLVDKTAAARRAELDLAEAIEHASAAADGAVGVSRDEEYALLDLNDQIRRTIKAKDDAGASTKDLQTIMGSSRQAFINTAIAMGMTQAEAQAYADTLNLIPEMVESSARLDTTKALTELDLFTAKVNESDGTILIKGNAYQGEIVLKELLDLTNNADGTVTINGNSYPADVTLQEFLFQADNAEGTVAINGQDVPAQQVLRLFKDAVDNATGFVNINGKDVQARQVLASLSAYIAEKYEYIKVDADTSMAQKRLRSLLYKARGVFAVPMAAGGVVNYFANGTESHVAQLAPAGAYRVWAEPETGGEAYIPLAPHKRGRSTRILEKVAEKFGYQLVPKNVAAYAAGATIGMASGDSRPVGFPSRLALVVDGREFTAYVQEKAGEIPGVQAASDLVDGFARYSAQIR